MKYKWIKNNLEEIVKTSKSKKEILEKLGLVSGGHNYKTLNKYLNYYDIDITHLRKNWANIVDIIKFRKLLLSEILIINSNYNRTHLKERLYKEGLKERKCEFCTQGEIWKGNKISLILDHINGIYNDNRLVNLRILCPNCNSGLSTHCGKTINKRKNINKKILNYHNLRLDLKNMDLTEILIEYGETARIKKMIKEIEILEMLFKSEIDFSKFGWVKDASKIIGIKDQVVNRWLKRVDPDFYSTCFTRKINNINQS